ncbi:MAG TPA: TIGR03086 family metal-binding protein [Propionibacteriaceae bacterium]
MSVDLGAPTVELARLVAGVSEDQLAGPTPCAETTVSAMLAHLHGLAVAFRDAAGKVEGPTTSTPPDAAAAVLVDDWSTAIPKVLTELAVAWRQPDAWTGMTKAGGVELPGEVGGLVANNELVVHGWDLAVATGQSYAVAPANLAASWEMVSQTPDEPEARQGLFGPVVPVPEDAPLLDRVLGGAGRDPGWTA